jgi:uncharacterized protein (TIGR02271 family)
MYETTGSGPLVRLSETNDFEIAADDADPTNWTVYSGEHAIGYVTDLLVDRGAMKVRYLEVQPGDEGASRSGEKVHIPVERVRLSSSTRRVELLGSEAAGIAGLTEFRQSGAMHAQHDVGHDFGATRASSTDEEAARVTRSEEELLVGKREVQAGEVVVRKTVETEHVREPVATRTERVRVERRPVEATASATPIVEGDEIRVPIMSEEVVVEKRPVMKEEIVITKEAVTETSDVQAELRKERVDVDTREDVRTAETVDESTRDERVRTRGGTRG